MNFLKKMLQILSIAVILLFLILTLIPIIFSYKKLIYDNLENLPEVEVVCLLGAKIYPKGELSPVIKQRCDALIELYKNKTVQSIYVSGSWKYEVNHIVKYLLNNYIDEKKIIKDYLGYDTHDTIRHIKKSGYKRVLLISQSFHLYRAIDMSKSNKLEAYGLSAEKIVPVHENISPIVKYLIKLQRYYKNSFLFLLYKIRLYDLFSREAENKEGLRLKISNP